MTILPGTAATGDMAEKPDAAPAQVFTIGHSRHTLPAFTALLLRHGVDIVVDVRSHPVSRFCPQFNQAPLATALAISGIGYEYHGDRLGARRTESDCLVDGYVSYARIAATPSFQAACTTLRERAQTVQLCLLCAERDPLGCHRTFLVGVRLRSPKIALSHVLADGTLEPHERTEGRLLALHSLDQEHLLWTPEERLHEAYRRQEAALAYRPPGAGRHAP